MVMSAGVTTYCWYVRSVVTLVGSNCPCTALSVIIRDMSEDSSIAELGITNTHTRSPTLKLVTLEPITTTVPAPSNPRICGHD